MLDILDHVFPDGQQMVIMLDLDELNNSWQEKTENTPPISLLGSWEQEKLNSFKREKRYFEWLGGRIAAKLAILAHPAFSKRNSSSVSLQQLEVRNLKNGRPIPSRTNELDKNELPTISISHSGSYALAIAADCSCGIDIQENRESLQRVQNHFCTGDEKAILHSSLPKLDEQLRLNLLWAAKEAVKKSMSPVNMPAFLDIHLVTIEELQERGWSFSLKLIEEPYTGKILKVATGLMIEYALAISLDPGVA